MQKIFLLALMLGVAPIALADYRMTPREAVYYWASEGSVKNLKALQKSGYSLDMPDAHGQQAICEAVDKKDVKAFKTLKKAGANMNVFCLYNMSQEKRYEFNQAYYGLPLVVPVMTAGMLEEEIVQPLPVLEVLPKENETVDQSVLTQDSLSQEADSVRVTSDSYEPLEESTDQSTSYTVDADETSVLDSVAFKPYVAANLFYAKTKAKTEVGADDKRSYNISDNVPGLALAFGTKISDFRAELAFQTSMKASDKLMSEGVKGSLQNYAFFLNGYYNIPIGMSLTPYVGAGVGMSLNKASLSDGFVKYNGSDWSFAWQLAAGLNYTLTDNLVADLGYRYTNYGKVNIVKENDVSYKMKDIRSHNVTLGLRYEM